MTEPERRPIAVVTGATSGIGLATVAGLVELGYEVYGTSRRQASDDSLSEAGGHPVRCDVTDPADRARLVDSIAECDLLVCSAGDNRPQGIADVQPEDWDHVFDVNARSLFFLNQAFGSRLRDGGSIVNVASTAARAAVPSVAVYAAAKAAVISITRSFALEYAPRGIRVNAVLPKVIDTPMQRRYLEGVAATTGEPVDVLEARRHAEIPLGRAGTAGECANTIIYLGSDGASYLTGQAINVCGGWLMS